MCSKGGGTPPVPSAASTTFNSTTQPAASVSPQYTDFLDRAKALSDTPFNTAQLGSVAPMNAQQTAAGNQMFDLGMGGMDAARARIDAAATNVGTYGEALGEVGRHMGDWDPNRVTEIMSPFTEQVVGTTQDWFNNQNAIQGNDLLSQAIRSGNAFGGDRAGIAEGILAGQQQLAQAPVIAGLREAGYTQALNEYNTLKQFGLAGAQAGLAGAQANLGGAQASMQGVQSGIAGAGAALGWGGLQQQQAQKEADVAQQNAMMQSAYPFQTLNWYGSILGGIGPLLGQTAFGSNNPPEASGLGSALGVGSAAVGLGTAALGAFGTGAGGATTDEARGGARGGSVERLPRIGRKRGGLVPVLVRHNGGIVAGLAYGGPTEYDPSSEEEDEARESKQNDYVDTPTEATRAQDTQGARQISVPNIYGQLKLAPRTLPQPILPQTTGGSQQPQKSETEQWLGFGKGLLDLGVKAAPMFAMLSDPKTKTDVQRVGKTDDGKALYGFRYRGDPKSYPKVVGPMARPPRPPKRLEDGGGSDEDLLTMTDLGVLDPRGQPLSPGIAGPARGSPAGFNPEQAEDMPNLARVRERFQPMLANNPALRQKFDVNTTAEVGTDPAKRDFYQALTLDRAAARGESLPYTLSRGPGTPDRYYPARTANATTRSGIGVSPALWGGANPANFGTGNASYDPVTRRHVGFAGGPQTGSAGDERGGVEGPDLAAVRRFGYRGPSTTAIGFGPGAPQGMYGGDNVAAAQAKASYPEGEREKVGAAPDTGRVAAGPTGVGGRTADAGTGPVGTKIPGAPPKTFAQNLAGNPFWQLGTALMAKPGIKGREGSAIGSALQSMSAQQIDQRKADILEKKPEMLNTSQGIMYRYPDGSIVPTGLKSEHAGDTEYQRKTQKPFAVERDTPGPFGSTSKSKEYYTYDENGNIVPFQSPAQAAPSGRQNVITPDQAPPQPPPQAPQAPPAPPTSAPQQPQPQLRQTEAKPAEPQQPQPQPQAPQQWSKDPASGIIRGPDGATYDSSGKQLSPPTAAAQPATPQIAQPGQQPAQVAAGPTETLKRVEDQWAKGVIKPGGAITNPAALNRNDAALVDSQGRPLSPDEIRIIKGIADYQLDPNKVFAGKAANLRGPAINKVLEYDPSYNQGQYAQRNAARKAYEVNGVEARNIVSQDMAVQHAARAVENVDKLNHSGRPWWNELRASPLVKNIFGSSDDPYQKALGQVKQDIHAVSNELMKVFRGGSGAPSEREAKRIADTLNVLDNPEVLKASLREGVELLYGRIHATAYRYNDAMGPAYARPTESWMSPEGRAAVQRVMNQQ